MAKRVGMEDRGLRKMRRAFQDVLDPRSVLTVVTATSPLRTNPSTDIIERSLKSLSVCRELHDVRHLVICDGSGDDALKEGKYEEYKRRLRVLASGSIFATRVEIYELERRVGLSGVILKAMSLVKTPFLLVYEHDFEMLRRVDVTGILRTLALHDDVHHIRLNKRKTHEAITDFILKADDRLWSVPLVRTSSWSAGPHFSTMAYYRRVVVPILREHPEGGTEDFEGPLFEKLCREIRAFGFDRAQRRWGVFIYGEIGEAAVVNHLDARRLALNLNSTGSQVPGDDTRASAVVNLSS